MIRGDIYIAELAPRSGSEQQGRRPVIVTSNDALHQTQNWRSVIILPISTSSARARRTLTVVPIPQGTGNLSKDGVALCHQITTLDRSKFEKFVRSLPARVMDEIEQGLKAAMDLL